MTSTRPAQAGSRAIPAAAGGAAIREMRAVQDTGPLSETSAFPLTGDFQAKSHVSFGISGQKTRQCRADIRLAWWIGSSASASEGRASRRKRQYTTKLVGTQLRQRSALDPSDRAQGEQQRSLKAVACPDGIHHTCCRRLDLHETRFTVPSLGSIDPTRNDDQTCTGRDKRPRPFIVVVS